MVVDELASYTPDLDLGCSRAHWLALPALSRVDCKRLAALCRLSPADLPAPYEAGAPAKLGYCYRRLQWTLARIAVRWQEL